MKVQVAVVGGGISGLAAAYRLRRLLGPAAEIVLIEGSRRLGGALRTVDLGGLPYDVGAEAFVVRRPEAVALVEELGLVGGLTYPTALGATLRVRGRSRPLPPRTMLGLPQAAQDVAAVLSTRGATRLAAEPSIPLHWVPGQDAAVGKLLRQRAGDELVDRLVDPLLGGVYAGRADALGLRATLPAVAAALDEGAQSLLAAAAVALRPGAAVVLPPGSAVVLPPGSGGEPASGAVRSPVFGTLRGGLGGLTDALVRAAAITPRLGMPVRGLTRRAEGWRLELGSAARPEIVDTDAVLLAVPAPALRRLLAEVLPAASAAVAQVEVASSAVVGLALPASAARALPQASGVLVAAGEPLTVKAFTFSGRKWAHAGSEEVLLVRGSLGRHGEAPALRRDDAELVEVVRADLAALTGITAEPVDTVVARWGGALPQYRPGHSDLVGTVQRAVAEQPGLAIAGATWHGVGVPACIGTAETAARRLADYLSTRWRPVAATPQ